MIISVRVLNRNDFWHTSIKLENIGSPPLLLQICLFINWTVVVVIASFLLQPVESNKGVVLRKGREISFIFHCHLQ